MKNNKASGLVLILAFLAIYIVWGTTYLANLYALKGMGPFVLSALRYLIAGSLLGGWALFRKLPWPEHRNLKTLAISGILMLIGGSGLVVYAEQYINSGYAAVIVATEPLWFVILDRSRWKLYFSNKLIITGLVMGFLGIVLFSYFTPLSQENEAHAINRLIGTLILLLSAVFWVMGTLYADRNTSPGKSMHITKSATQLLIAGVVCVAIALLHGEWQSFKPMQIPLLAWAGLIFLVIMGSLVAYLSFMWLVTVQPPAIVSTHTYINPVIAILIGWFAEKEPVSLSQVISLVIIFVGVMLTRLFKTKSSLST